jgi:hypothetical protein
LKKEHFQLGQPLALKGKSFLRIALGSSLVLENACLLSSEKEQRYRSIFEKLQNSIERFLNEYI